MKTTLHNTFLSTALITLTLTFVLVASNTNAQVCFGANATYATGGTNPQYGTTADFNGDGHADLAIANQTLSTVSILLANSTGGFAGAAGSPHSVGSTPVSVAVADFNGDGFLDVATANYGGSISILLGTNNSGGLGTATTITGGTNPYSIATGDFNGDSKPDLVMIDNSSSNSKIYIFLNTGSPTTPFSTSTTYATGSQPWMVVVADFNGDGKPDVATSSSSTAAVSILLNNGTGGFGTLTSLATAGVSRSIVAADFNGDGHADIATANSGTSNVSVLLNTGTFASPYSLSFATHVDYSIGTSATPYGIAAADFNGDGKIDIATCGDASPYAVAVLQNNGSGVFNVTPVRNFTQTGLSSTNYAVIAGDFNGDGKPDIATTSNGASAVSILLNTAVPSSSQTLSVCGSYNGHTTSGTYTDFLASSKGCDSVVTTNLTVNTISNTTQSFSKCAGQSVTENGHTYSSSGTYEDIIAGSPCYSIVKTILSVTYGSGAASFSSAASFPAPSGGGPQYGTSGDFNGDGKADLAISNQSTAKVSVLLANSTGGFNSAVTYSVGNTPVAVATADFNGDGTLDLATANYGSPSPGISILLGNSSGGTSPNERGDGTFGTATTIGLGTHPYGVVAGDFNGDGKPDLAVGDNGVGGNNVYIFLNSGNATTPFSTYVSYPSGINPWNIVTADFNGDGILDLAMGSSGGTTIAVLLGKGDGTFGSATPFTVGSAPRALVVQDFNGDGKFDLAAGYNSGVGVLINNGTGGALSFATVATYLLGTSASNPYGITAADLNGDGILDLATGNQGSTNFSVLLGNGAGGFSSGIVYQVAAGASSIFGIIAADFNGDGEPDLEINANNSTNSLVLNLKTSLATATASSPVCTSGTNNSTLTLAAPVGLATYSWTGPNSFTSSLQSPTIVNPTTLAEGVYSVTAVSSGGCTSTGTTSPVVINSPVTHSQTLTVCNSLTVGSVTHTASGVYTDVLVSPRGCDSTVTTNLTVNGQPFTQNITLCGGQSIMVGTKTHNATGTYVDKLIGQAVGGCDSVVTTNLKVFYGVGAATFSTSAAITSDIGSQPYVLATADFNGDGNPDLAVPNNGTTSVSILLGNGSGGFNTAPSLTTANPWAVAAFDYDGDGKIDLAITNQNANTVTIFKGNGAGGFTSVAAPGTGSLPRQVVSADFNNDGKPDLAIANQTTSNVTILLGNGSGGFATVTGSPFSSDGSAPVGLAAGDFNNDGKIDLAVGNSSSADVVIFKGNGDGTFTSTFVSSVGSSPYAVMPADFDGDGNTDLAVASNSSSITILKGNGSGGFSSTLYPLPASSAPQFGAIADFNGDGNLDVAAACQSSNAVDILLGNGNGTFNTTVTVVPVPGGNNSAALVSADFNSDGRPDLAVTNFSAASLSILLNTNSLASVSATNPVCTSGSHSMLNLSDAVGGLVSYSWTGPNGFTSSLQNTSISSPTTAAAGVYTLTVVDSHSCTVTAKTPAIAVNSATTFTQTISACGSYTVGATVHTSSGTFTDVLTSSKGCDSTVTTNLTINHNSNFSQTLALCAGQSVIVGAVTHNATGTYVDNLTSANGCDSIVTTNLTIYFSGGSPPAFTTATGPYSVGTNPQYGAVGDFNNDGQTDVITANQSTNNISVLLNTGGGTFGAAKNTTVGTTPVAVAVGDFNGDGKLDAAVANYSSNNVTVILGNGDGTFSTVVNSYATGSNCYGVTVADFNGDGILDIAACNNGNSGSNTISVLFGNGNGTFQTPALSLTGGGNPWAIAAADFNGDGKPDIATSNNAGNVSVLLNNGSGGFTVVNYTTTSSTPRPITIGDFNGDGKPDIASGNYYAGNVSILMNNGTGGFTLGTAVTTGGSPMGLATGDFNGDGKIDLAVNTFAGMLQIFLGNGSGGFGTTNNFTVGNQSYLLANADFNGDGKPDLVAASNPNSNVSVLINSTTFATASATTPVCSGGSMNSTLTLTGGASGLTSYKWTGPGGYTSSSQSPNIVGPSTANAGIYTLTVSESHGCTGSASTGAVVVNAVSAPFSQTVTACSSFKVGNIVHSSSGTFTDVISSAKGCDSSVTTNLTILLPGFSSQTLTICAGQNIIVGTTKHTATGTYVDKLAGKAANGCDSTVTTKLTVFFNTGNASFSTATITSDIGTNPYVLTSADFNNDGIPDLAIPNNGSNTVSILLGNGSGGFTSAATLTTNTSVPWSVISADFNGDGKADLAVTQQNASSVSVFLGNGLGGFTADGTYPTGLNGLGRIVIAADFNNDHNIDLAVTNQGTPGSITVLLGNGSGSFSRAPNTPFSTVGSNAIGLNTADFNNDGNLDLAVGNNASSDVLVFFGNGDGSFNTVSPVTLITGANPYAILIGDFNNDTKPDIVTSNSAGNVSVFLGNGTGGFSTPSPNTFTTAGGSQFAAVGDFNGDGNLDVATANTTPGNATILLGNGSGGFSTPLGITTGTTAAGLTSADFNGDGKPDIAVANFSSASVSILLNTVPTLLPTIGAGATPSSICLNDNSILAGTGGVSYSWAPSTGLTLTTGTSINASPAVNTTYTVTGTDVHGCMNTSTTTITLKAPVPLAVNPQSAVCTGQTNAVLSASGAASYVWAPTGNLTPSAGTGATETAQISQLTFYTVTATGADGCTANQVIPVATVATGGQISPAFSIICSGGTKTLTVTGAAGHDYQWQISSDNINWSNVTGATNTTYTTASGDGNSNKFYRLLAQSNSCWNVASTSGEVDVSIPNIIVSATNITDNSLTLNWSPTGTGNYSISYSGPSSATFTSVTPAKTITGLTANGTYSITVTQTGVSGCPASGTITGVNTLCAMPTGVTVSSPAPAQIQVSWTGVPGADYRVYYRPLFSYNTYFTKDVSNASSVLLTKQGANNLYASNTYEVYVSRLDCPTTGVVGQGTNPINVTTLPTVACATPVIDSVRSLCPVQIEVFIHDNGVNQYNVYIQRITPSILAVNSYGVSGTYFTINTPYSGDQFLIAVDARCAGGSLSSLYIYPGNVTVKPICSGPTNLVLSNPICHGFTASWNADQCLSNSASQYAIYLRVAGTINYNNYGVPLPASGIGPHELLNFLTSGRTYQVFVRSVYNCNGFVTYGPSSQVETITTLSSGCRDEDAEQPEENKPATQQYSPDNSEVFSLYPNPNTGKFIVDLSRLSMEEDAVRIEVINMLGQTVMTQLTTIGGGHMSEYVNLPNGTAAGTYIVRLTAGKNVYTTKINISK